AYRTPTQEGASNRLLDTVLGARAMDADPLIVMVVVALVTFGLFAVARYLAGMTRVDEWRLLRGGSAYLLGNCVAMIGVFAGFVVAVIHSPGVLAFMGLVLPLLMVLLGFEIGVKMVTSVYRPRKPGEAPQAAFESWVLGWLSSPQSLARIINQTVNYQFGFEISRSWFYQLLGRAITPLVVFGLLVLILISSVVVVEPHQQAMKLTFGRMHEEPLEPGLRFKWPWPIGSVVKKDVGRVQQMFIGSIITKTEEDQAILWTNVHTHDGEETFILCAPTRVDRDDHGMIAEPGAAPAIEHDDFSGVGMVAAEIVMQYRIDDLPKFLRTADNPEQLLRAVAEREVIAFFGGRTIDQLLRREHVASPDGERVAMGEALRRAIQNRVSPDAMNLGIEVVLVSVTNVHPPQAEDVAATFHEQIGAMQEAEQRRLDARNVATQTLARVAGDEATALRIDQAIGEHNRLESAWNAAHQEGRVDEAEALWLEVQNKQREIEDMLNAARGQAAARIYSARAQRWETQLDAEDFVRLFDARRRAYQLAPEYYIDRLAWKALTEALRESRIYVLTPGTEAPFIRIDLKETAGLEGLFED
ncbi:MAG: hypothetical protein JJU36_17855, partial [Phycisphaeraceae bacterium]|nr:hypothetical protein [Phycisphaeraceae bacterium]